GAAVLLALNSPAINFRANVSSSQEGNSFVSECADVVFISSNSLVNAILNVKYCMVRSTVIQGNGVRADCVTYLQVRIQITDKEDIYHSVTGIWLSLPSAGSHSNGQKLTGRKKGRPATHPWRIRKI